MQYCKISVIVPVFNAERYLEQCLTSLSNQNFEDVEIICVNDASTDSSLDIIKGFSRKQSNVHVIENEHNMGLSYSRNIGIEHSSGKYVLFLDADDYVSDNLLGNLYLEAERDDLDILAFGYHEVSGNYLREISRLGMKDQSIQKGWEFLGNEELNKSTIVMAWACLYKRSFLICNDIGFEVGIFHEDYLFYVECMEKAVRVSASQETGYFYRRHEGSISLSDDLLLKRIEGLAITINRFLVMIHESTNQRFSSGVISLLRNVISNMITLYRRIDSIEEDFRWSNQEIESVLMLCKSCLYGGYFLYKLTPEQMETIRGSEVVIIYGAGKVGKGMKELLEERGVKKIKFAATEPEDKILSIRYYVYLKDKAVVVIANSLHSYEMKKNAEVLGYKSIVLPRL